MQENQRSFPLSQKSAMSVFEFSDAQLMSTFLEGLIRKKYMIMILSYGCIHVYGVLYARYIHTYIYIYIYMASVRGGRFPLLKGSE